MDTAPAAAILGAKNNSAVGFLLRCVGLSKGKYSTKKIVYFL